MSKCSTLTPDSSAAAKCLSQARDIMSNIMDLDKMTADKLHPFTSPIESEASDAAPCSAFPPYFADMYEALSTIEQAVRSIRGTIMRVDV
jgi:hypothetical protein